MDDIDFAQRLNANRLRLSADDAAKLADIVAESDRAAARLRDAPLGTPDEPAVVFRP